jgi:hypothetical protein
VVAISQILRAIYWNSNEFLAVPPVSMEGYYSKLIIFNGATTVIRDANMVAILKFPRTTTRRKIKFLTVFSLRCMGSTEYSYLSLYIH